MRTTVGLEIGRGTDKFPLSHDGTNTLMTVAAEGALKTDMNAPGVRLLAYMLMGTGILPYFAAPILGGAYANSYGFAAGQVGILISTARSIVWTRSWLMRWRRAEGALQPSRRRCLTTQTEHSTRRISPR